MKTAKRLILTIGLISSALALQAAPPSKQTAPVSAQTLKTTSDFEQVQPGDRIALICKECDSVSVETVNSKEEAMQHCAEGQKVTCPSCKTVAKVERHGPSGKQGRHLTTKVVNAKGEECMFFAKLP